MPKVHILYENKELPYLLGTFFTFTRKAEDDPILGSGAIGWEYKDILATKGTQINPKGKLQITADEVKGLEKPKIRVRQLLKAFDGKDYPMEGNVITAPDKPGVYIFGIEVDWSKGGPGTGSQNDINYLFKVTVE